MTTFVNLQSDVRSRLVEPTARLFSDVEIKRWINQGYHDFICKTEWAERVKAVAVVANQFEYTIDSDVLKVSGVRWDDKYNVTLLDQTEFHNTVGTTSASASTRPWFYTEFPWDKKIRVYPIPSADGAATTLAGAHNSSVTTITLTSATSFPSFGRIIVDTEQILYYAKSGNDLLQCVRGDGETTAASHSDLAAVSEGKMTLLQRYDPVDMSADGDTPRIPTAHDEALIVYATAIGLSKRDRWPQYDRLMAFYDERVKRALAERTKQQQDRLFAIKEDEAWF